MSTPANPTREEVREELEDRLGDDFDDDEFEDQVEEYNERFGDNADEDFAAWAVAYVECGETIDSDYSLPGDMDGGSGDSTSMEDLNDAGEVLLDEIEDNVEEDDEFFEVRGYYMNSWEGETGSGNPKRSLRMIDESGARNISAYRETNMEVLEEFLDEGIEMGDFIRAKGLTYYTWEDEESGDTGAVASIPYWTEFNVEEDPDIDLKEVAKDVANDIVNVGDFVYTQGVVTDASLNEYSGCVGCSKNYDEDHRVCPSCGEEERKDYTIGNVKVKSGDKVTNVSFSPSEEAPSNDLLFQEVLGFGEYTNNEYNGTEYKEIDVDLFEVVSDDGFGFEDTETEDEESEEDTEEESDDSEEGEESSESDSGPEKNGDFESYEEIEVVEEKIVDLGNPVPATVGRTVLQRQCDVEDEDRVVEILEDLKNLDTITVNEEDGSVANKDWEDVKIEPAD